MLEHHADMLKCVPSALAINHTLTACRCSQTCRSKLHSTLSDPTGSSYGSWRASLIWRRPAGRCPDVPYARQLQHTRDLWPGRSLNGPPCPPEWSPTEKRIQTVWKHETGWHETWIHHISYCIKHKCICFMRSFSLSQWAEL